MLTIDRLRRGARLAALTAEAWTGLVLFDAGRLVGFAGIHRYVAGCRVRTRRTGSPDAIVWAVDEACVWSVTRAFCLQRSTVAAWMLRRHGFDGSLVIGYRAVPFESHAWVELDGVVVNDRPQYQTHFHVLERV
jgi:hypothetical protein